MNIESLSRLCLYIGLYIVLIVVAFQLGELHDFLKTGLFFFATIFAVFWWLKLRSLNADFFHKELIFIVSIIFAITAMLFLINDFSIFLVSEV